MMFEHVLFLSVYLFSIGIYGLITSRNMVRALICLELILNSINLNLVTFSDLFDSRQLKGDIFAIFVIALAAAEAAIGLSILSSIHRNRKSTRINQSNFWNNQTQNPLNKGAYIIIRNIKMNRNKILFSYQCLIISFFLVGYFIVLFFTY